MFQSIQIANYFIKKRLDTGRDLTPMKLIKLCYIAHGWYCGFNNQPLLNETIYAWKYGPVVPSIYEQFKHYGSGQIDKLCNPNPFDDSNNFPLPDDESVKNFLDAIWNSYSKYDGIKLSSMTHQPGTPWDRVWNQENGKKQLDAVIPNDYITEYYKQRIRDNNTAPAPIG